MTKTTYSVFNSNDSDNAARGLSLADAADRLLTGDGHRYEIRRYKSANGGGFQLFVSQNSTLGDRPLVSTRFISVKTPRRAAVAEIFAEVLSEAWHGSEAMSDADFDAFQAEWAD